MPVQQLLTAATPADEDERADVRTAGSLVLRLYDPSRVLKLAAAEGGRPVGVTALDLLVITHAHRGW